MDKTAKQTEEKHFCEKRELKSMWSMKETPCGKPAKHFEDGQWRCGRHTKAYEEKAKERREASYKKYCDESDARIRAENVQRLKAEAFNVLRDKIKAGETVTAEDLAAIVNSVLPEGEKDASK